jgi:hypothetical protein
MSERDTGPLIEELAERMYGPVIAWFTVGEEGIKTGAQPPGIEAAWAGIELPVRERLEPSYDGIYVAIDAAEAYNALVAAGARDTILQYWIDVMDTPRGRKLGNLFHFPKSDGELDYFEKD